MYKKYNKFYTDIIGAQYNSVEEPPLSGEVAQLRRDGEVIDL